MFYSDEKLHRSFSDKFWEAGNIHRNKRFPTFLKETLSNQFCQHPIVSTLEVARIFFVIVAGIHSEQKRHGEGKTEEQQNNIGQRRRKGQAKEMEEVVVLSTCFRLHSRLAF